MLIFVGGLFFLIGLAVLVGGIFSVLKIWRQVANSGNAEGIVVGFEKTMGQRGFLYCPLVQFQVPGGQPVQFQSETGSQPPAYAIGNRVQVVYETNNPNRAEINSAMALWFVPGCTVLMAVFFTLFGLTLVGVGIFVETLAGVEK